MEERVMGMRRTGKPRKGMINDLKEAFVRKRLRKMSQRKERIREGKRVMGM